MSFPKSFRPQSAEDFIGPAALMANIIEGTATEFKNSKEPAMFLFYGAPGCAKTQLAKHMLRCFNVGKWNLKDYAGADLDIEKVRDFANELHMTSMFPGYRGMLVDEVDMMPQKAQGRFLKVCDDVPEDMVLVVTCNSDIEDLEPRFQSRFQTFEIEGPTGNDVIPLLEKWLNPQQARQLVEGATEGVLNKRVDVRALLNDATTMLTAK